MWPPIGDRTVDGVIGRAMTSNEQQPARHSSERATAGATSNGLYYSFNEYCHERFGERVERLAIDAGFSCPHRASRIDGGCTYCGPRGSRAPYVDPYLSVKEQLANRVIELKGRAKKFAAYFQAYTNTDASLKDLRRLYEEALEMPGVVMLIVGTRPDCLPGEVLDLLGELGRSVEVWLELGLQSAHDRTLKRINRGHNYASFATAVREAEKRGIKVAAHMIVGLPGEGRQEVLATAEALAGLAISGVKIHSLHVVKGASLAEDYASGKLKVLSRKDYVRWCCDCLERLPADVVVGRLTGEAPREILVEPRWCLEKTSVVRAIEEELKKRGSHQGFLFKRSRRRERKVEI